jgi:hypothetical protein
MMFQTERLAFNAEKASLDDDLERSYGSGGPIHESTTGILPRLSLIPVGFDDVRFGSWLCENAKDPRAR